MPKTVMTTPSRTFYQVKLESVRGYKSLRKEDYEPETKFGKLRKTLYSAHWMAMIDAIRWNYRQYILVLDDEDVHSCIYTYDKEGKRVLKEDRLEMLPEDRISEIYDRVYQKVKERAPKNCGLMWFAYVKSVEKNLY